MKMKIRSYVAAILLAFVCLVIANNNAFAQQQPKMKPQAEQPSWMKKKGYDETVKNVYFPVQDMYYNVKNKVYIYKDKGEWKQASQVPSKFSNVDLDKASAVKLTKNTTKPQKENDVHKKGNTTSSSKPKAQQNPSR